MPRKKESKKSSEDLANDIEAWLAKGNEIHQVQVHENRWHKDKGGGKQAALTVVQKQSKHRWAKRDYEG